MDDQVSLCVVLVYVRSTFINWMNLEIPKNSESRKEMFISLVGFYRL